MADFFNGISGLICNIVIVVIALSIIPLMLKMFIPSIGRPLWDAYWAVVRLVAIAPIRIVQFLIRELRKP